MENPAPRFPLEIDHHAVVILKRMLNREPLDGQFIRVGVKGGGCSGFEYILKVDTIQKPNDLNLEIDGITIACDAKSAKYLEGAKLVTSGNLIGGGLKFNNPNVDRSCGCGSSFSLKKN